VLILGNEWTLWKIRFLYFVLSPAKFQLKIAAGINKFKKKKKCT